MLTTIFNACLSDDTALVLWAIAFNIKVNMYSLCLTKFVKREQLSLLIFKDMSVCALNTRNCYWRHQPVSLEASGYGIRLKKIYIFKKIVKSLSVPCEFSTGM